MFLIIGLGVQGKKRIKTLKKNSFKTVDPVNPDADYRTLQEAIKNRNLEFKFAIICTPDSLKFETISFCLKNNMHVMVEKPLIFNRKENYYYIRDLSRKKKLVVYTAYNHRFEHFIVKIKNVIEKKTIGKIYFCNMSYGNGTAKLVKKSNWKDKSSGVIFDLGSHLLDFIDFIFNIRTIRMTSKSVNKFENNSPDHAIINYKYKKINFNLEMTYCMWRNSFQIDIIGSKGSIHMNNFCKWGTSEFIFRKRKFPAGFPIEKKYKINKKDLTWKKELDYFLSLVDKKILNNFNKDIWIYEELKKIKHV